MVQLITFLVVVAALVALVLQNLSPVLGLVVLGQTTPALPLAVWLLCAIAIGALCTLLIYQLVPTQRTYRPMGKRLSNPPPEPTNRFVDAPDEPVSNRFQSPPNQASSARNAYDRDWNDFKAPEQWEDWGQQPAQPSAGQQPAASDYRSSSDDTMRDIESGWGEDDYEASGRFSHRRNAGPDQGWDNREDYPERPATRSYEEGWLYGNEADSEGPEQDAPPPEEDVYDANYRVIIPPYESKND
ncbi:MAG: hypothetical protein AAFY17_03360 [Cyanobacteria bacterium J06642_11]